MADLHCSLWGLDIQEESYARGNIVQDCQTVGRGKE
jgi:hypothetical protein